MHTKIKLAILCTGLAFAPSLHATTYWVDASFTGTSNGTQYAPDKTITAAANRMLTPGHTCNIAPGNYPETVPVQANNLTFQRKPGATGNVIISGTEPIAQPSWSQESPGSIIWYVDLNPAGITGDEAQVFQGAAGSQVMRSEARWPFPGASYPWENSRYTPTSQTDKDTWSEADFFPLKR